MSLATRRVVIACFCGAALAAVGCAGGSMNPVGPSASPAASSLAATASFARSGELHVIKECSTWAGQAGDVCTITSSNLKEIEVGSRVVYAQAANFGTFTLDSDVVLDPPGHGNNTASGHCHLNLVTGIGLCTFSGGTGQERPGKAVGRYDLMEAVWGHRNPTASNVVDVVVRSLRRKLGADAASVETVRGTGYRYRVPTH